MGILLPTSKVIHYIRVFRKTCNTLDLTQISTSIHATKKFSLTHFYCTQCATFPIPSFVNLNFTCQSGSMASNNRSQRTNNEISKKKLPVIVMAQSSTNEKIITKLQDYCITRKASHKLKHALKITNRAVRSVPNFSKVLKVLVKHKNAGCPLKMCSKKQLGIP